MGLNWHKYLKKREEKAENLNRLGLKCEVFLASVTENNHKKGSNDLGKSGIPSQSLKEYL